MCSPAGTHADVPDIVDVNEHARVIQLKAGPADHVAKEALPELIDEFAARWRHGWTIMI